MIKGKRGLTNIQFFIIAEAVLAVIIFIAILSYIQGVATNSLFEQNFLARDVALLIDTAYAAPGELNVNYDVSVAENRILFLPKFSPEIKLRLVFDNSKVFVFRGSKGELYQKPASYLFGEDPKLELILPEQAGIDELEQTTADEYSIPNVKSNILIKKSADELSVEFTEIGDDEFEEAENE